MSASILCFDFFHRLPSLLSCSSHLCGHLCSGTLVRADADSGVQVTQSLDESSGILGLPLGRAGLGVMRVGELLCPLPAVLRRTSREGLDFKSLSVLWILLVVAIRSGVLVAENLALWWDRAEVTTKSSQPAWIHVI